jgi:hypothetical protein
LNQHVGLDSVEPTTIRARRGFTKKMRKILLAALALALLAALAPGQASARHTLAHKVAILEAKMACIRKYPVNEFGDFALYDTVSGTPSGTAIDTDDGLPVAEYGPFLFDNLSGFGIDFNYGYNFGPDAWLLGVRNTSTCLARFTTGADPLARSATATRKAHAAKAIRQR